MSQSEAEPAGGISDGSIPAETNGMGHNNKKKKKKKNDNNDNANDNNNDNNKIDYE